MCAAALRLLRCCVTPDTSTSSSGADRATSVRDVVIPSAGVATDNTWWSSMPCGYDACHTTARYIFLDVADADPSLPVPVCCCERCDGARWFSSEVTSLHMRACLLADHVTSGGKTAGCRDVRRRRHCTAAAWTGDVIYLDDCERAEMSQMSADIKGVDLLVRIDSTIRRLFAFCCQDKNSRLST